MTIGNRTNAATQAARQVIDMAENALVRQPGRSGLAGRRAHRSRSLAIPVPDHTGHDAGIGAQVTAKYGKTHQGHPIINAGFRVRLLA
jgi:hypothetical protein